MDTGLLLTEHSAVLFAELLEERHLVPKEFLPDGSLWRRVRRTPSPPLTPERPREGAFAFVARRVG
jgi:hypothetical protein